MKLLNKLLLALRKRHLIPGWSIRGKHTRTDAAINPVLIDSRACGLIDIMQSGWFQNATNELFDGFPISADDVVVDVGCGGGGQTLFCANRGAHVIFTDLVQEKIDSLRERVAQSPARKFEGLVSDSNPLQIADRTASRVVALEVLEHVTDPAQVMQELVRVGQPGALYLLAVPDARGEKIQQAFAPAYYFERPNHIHIFEQSQFADLATHAGLEIISHSTYGFYWTFWMFIYWTWANAEGKNLEGVSHDVVQPPHPPILNEWAKLWHQLIAMPESAPMKKALDELLPKSQVIVARKPW